MGLIAFSFLLCLLGIEIPTENGIRSFSNGNPVVQLNGFFVEAEHYDYDGGKFVPAVNTMPYSGQEYSGLGAVHNVDYHQTEQREDPGMLGYRVGDVPNVPMYRQADPETLDVMRGGFAVTENYTIGYANEGDWFNYTRTFTNGNYYVYAAQSHGDAVGTPNRLRVRFAIAAGNTAEQFGGYEAPATGEYGVNEVNQVMNGPVPAVVHLSGVTTIRVFQDEGDLDWFVFVPTTNVVSPDLFVIEAEDFDFGRGQSKTQASAMPLVAGLYEGLSAIAEVDYHVAVENDDAGAQGYRVGEIPNVRISDNSGSGMNVRGKYALKKNQRVWIDSGEWFNFTRTFPTGNYNVFAALSHAGGGPTSGKLGLVGSAASLTALGTFFEAGGTGGWGNNRLVPLKDNQGNLASIALEGTRTLRYSATSGDFDYLVLVPLPIIVKPPSELVRIERTESGQYVITWDGEGTLEASNGLGANARWQPIGGGGSVSILPFGKSTFFRVSRPQKTP